MKGLTKLISLSVDKGKKRAAITLIRNERGHPFAHPMDMKRLLFHYEQPYANNADGLPVYLKQTLKTQSTQTP